MNSICSIQKSFEVNGINVTFEDRIFKIHTKDEILEDMVLNYLEVEGFFQECNDLYKDDWGI